MYLSSRGAFPFERAKMANQPQQRVEPIVRLEIVALDPVTRRVTIRYTFNNGNQGIILLDEKNPLTINLNVPVDEPKSLDIAQSVIQKAAGKPTPGQNEEGSNA